MRNKLITLLSLLFAFCLPPNVHAAEYPFNDLIFFGDSLSDSGNLYYRTFGFIPKSPPYFAGRFSNGPTWAESVADHYKAQNQMESDNFAVGSASAVFHNPVKGYLPYTLTMAVYNYLVRYAWYDKTHTLFTIWIGANDYMKGADDVDDATTAVVNAIGDNIETLIGREGKYFLLMNLPDISKTPLGKTSDKAANLSALSEAHNRKLAIKVAELQKKYPETIIRIYDIYSDFEVLTKDPDVYNKKYNINLTNITESCWPGWYSRKHLQPDALAKEIKQHWQKARGRDADAAKNYVDADQLANTIINTPALAVAYGVGKQFDEGDKPCDNPDNHVFWDHVHPSRVVHAVFGNIMTDFIDKNYLSANQA